MRRVVIGSLWGTLPGALIIAIAAVLHSLDIISADQTQAAFIGLPLLAIGLPIGLLVGASAADNTWAVAAGMAAGSTIAVVLAIALTRVFEGAWMVLVPAFMLAGALFRAWRHDHRAPVPPLARQ